MGNRSARAALAIELDEIVARGHYTVSMHDVDIEAMVESAVAGTHLHPPDDPALDTWPRGDHAGRVEVTDETTLAACQRLAADGDEPACLNFASAKQPGGGYRSGADGQEESLARSSALAACLAGVTGFYEQHQGRADPAYTDDLICSPGVPVVRDEGGALRAEPYRVTFLSAAPPNAAALLMRGWRGDLRAVIEQRARRVLAAAAVHGRRRLVLGAWGCAIFRNEPEMVADAFASLLDDGFAGSFDLVTFAVTDVVASAPMRTAFEKRVGSTA